MDKDASLQKGLPMLDQEPLTYPFRSETRFPFNPGVPDRQLWALGMIVVQWSMTESLLDIIARKLIGDDKAVLAEYEDQRNFQQYLEFWKTQIELKCQEPVRSQALAFIPRIHNLSSQRDEVVHRMWAANIKPGESWSLPTPNPPSIEADLMKGAGEVAKMPNAEGLTRLPVAWRTTFHRLRRMAQEMATLNRDLMRSGLPPGSPPSGN